MTPKELVSTREVGGIRVIVADNPPVNALSRALRQGLFDAISEAAMRKLPVIVACAGRSFFAGADISEFGAPPQPPILRQLIEALENHPALVVAAIHGTALGGGLELALGCHFRIAAPDAKLGLPEVKLGLLPGAGGTQRLPRLIGVPAALDMIVSGEPVSAKKALELGLVDRLTEGDLVEGAIAFTRELVNSGVMPRRLSETHDKVSGVDPAIFRKHEAAAAKRARGQIAPGRAIRAVEAAATMPFADGMELERQMFAELRVSPESQAQRHLFFAAREAAKVPDIPRDVTTRPVKSLAVIGAGTMGGGIAMVFANAGLPVTLVDSNAQATERGLAQIRKNYESTVKRGGLTPQEAEARIGRIRTSTEIADCRDANLIIEAVFEDMELKKKIFAELSKITKPEAILATNTSTLDVDQIALAVDDPTRVLGLHFFSPANVMQLVEVVRGRQTAKDVIATALALARRIDKVPVVVGVCDGFVGNRMLGKRHREVERLLMTGALPEQIDRVLTDFGFPMGPLAMADLAGLDVAWRVRQARGVSMAIADGLYAAGRYGQKNGKGYYRYEPGDRSPHSDPEVEALILATAKNAGVDRRSFTDAEILERLLYPMINEGARILREGIAARPGDIDVIWAHGYGWPVSTGGPMHYADRIRPARIAQRLSQLHEELSEPSLKPDQLLLDLADGSFADWGKTAEPHATPRAVAG